ncbi:MAG: hypothetical protein ACRDGF_10415, partial [Chloroflexota bacterium]
MLTLAAGIYRTSRMGSLAARRHLSAFVATASVPSAAGSMLAVAPPLKQSRFSSIGRLDRLLRGKP